MKTLNRNEQILEETYQKLSPEQKTSKSRADKLAKCIEFEELNLSLKANKEINKAIMGSNNSVKPEINGNKENDNINNHLKNISIIYQTPRSDHKWLDSETHQKIIDSDLFKEGHLDWRGLGEFTPKNFKEVLDEDSLTLKESLKSSMNDLLKFASLK